MASPLQYTRHQQFVSLSFLTNIGNNRKETPSQLQQFVFTNAHNIVNSSAARALIGNWSIVWGPAVFTKSKFPNKETYATNTLMVSQQGNTILVTVAGTNAQSIYDWCTEDFKVGTQVPWDPTAPNKGVIAEGTSIGLNILLKLADPNTGKTLIQFLHESNLAAGTEVVVSGHSLGGALTPVLALALDNLRAEWGGNNLKIYAFPTAGPTPGDAAWANYFRSVFHDDLYYGLKNSLDVVPHAWDETTTANLASIYVPNIQPDSHLTTLVTNITNRAKGKNYKQIAGQVEFTGTFKPPVVKDKPNPTIVEQYLAELLIQHISAYHEYFKIEAFIALFPPAAKKAFDTTNVGPIIAHLASASPELARALANENVKVHAKL